MEMLEVFRDTGEAQMSWAFLSVGQGDIATYQN
jgi:hypothetical protein